MRPSLRIPLYYAFFSILWIAFSDVVVAVLVEDARRITAVQTYKGWAFVAASALLLVYVLRSEFKNRERVEATLKREIAERAEAQEELNKSSALINDLYNNAPCGYQSLDENAVFVHVNNTELRWLGHTAEELIGKMRFTDVVTEESRSVFTENFSLLKALGWMRDVEVDLIRQDGSAMTVLLSATAIKDDAGKFVMSRATLFDITERKKVEEALTESNERISAISEGAIDGIVMVDEEGVISYLNPSAEKMLGYSRKEAVGHALHELIVSEEARGKYHLALEGFRRTGRCDVVGRPLEFNVLRKDRTTFPAEVSIVSMKIRGKWHSAGSIKDITERKRAEEERKRLEGQLRQSQKMEAVGQLAGGIAHDFNNLLTVILGYGETIKAGLKGEEPVSHYVDIMVSAAQKAAGLTQSLLAFSRKQIISPSPVGLNEIVRGVEKILRRILGENISIETSLHAASLTVLADKNQMEQVLINICTNARDAMPDGGTLTIETGPVVADEEFTKAHAFEKKGMYAVISVSDTGVGMDEATRQKVFEPFFTTKPPGKGTGLGLSIAYGIVKQHGGYINVYSEPGKGSTFRIYLPLMKTEALEEVKEAPSPIRGGTETILIAEDNEDIRKLIKTVLERNGYTVVTAADGLESVRLFEEMKDTISLSIFDVIMPNMNGKEAYDAVRKIAPKAKALFISGYTADVLAREGILDAGLHYIPKPIVQNEFLRKVRDILDSDA